MFSYLKISNFFSQSVKISILKFQIKHHIVLKQNTGAFQKYFKLFHNFISKNKIFKSKKVNLKAGSDSKESFCNAGDLGSIPELGRSPGKGHGNPLQYSCLLNSKDRGTWQAKVHGVTKNRTQLSNFTSLHTLSDFISLHFVISETSRQLGRSMTPSYFWFHKLLYQSYFISSSFNNSNTMPTLK